LVIPVPSSTAEVGGFSVVGVREDALTVFKVISLEASCAVSVISVGLAEVRNRNTNFVCVEHPSIRASETFLIVPVPGCTS